MADPIDLHIMPGERGWKILGAEDALPLATADTREDAVSLAAHLVRVRPGIRRIFVHEPDGTVHERSSLDHRDPFPRRDRR